MIESGSQNTEHKNTSNRSIYIVGQERSSHRGLIGQGFTPAFVHDEDLIEQIHTKKPDMLLLENPNAQYVAHTREAVGRLPIVATTDDRSVTSSLLNAGSDHVGTVSYLPYEMGAHMRAILRRTDAGEEKPRVVQIGKNGNISVDTRDGVVSVNGGKIRFTNREAQLLSILISKDRLMSLDELTMRIWGEYIQEGAAAAVASRVNKRLKNFNEKGSVIKTIFYVGYYISGYTDRNQERVQRSEVSAFSVNLREYKPEEIKKDKPVVYIAQDVGIANLLRLDFKEMEMPFIAFTNQADAQEYLLLNRPRMILKGDGVDINKSNDNTVPIIAYSRDHSSANVARELNDGAYTYISAPASSDLLRSVLSRIPLKVLPAQSKIGDVEIDWEMKGLRVNGVDVLLSPKEWETLRILRAADGKTLSTWDIESLTNESYEPDAALSIYRIRTVLGKNIIKSRYRGYTLGEGA